MVSLVCVSGLCGCFFVKGVLLGYSERILLGRVNGCELELLDGIFLGDFEWTPYGRFGNIFCWKL